MGRECWICVCWWCFPLLPAFLILGEDVGLVLYQRAVGLEIIGRMDFFCLSKVSRLYLRVNAIAFL